MEVFQIKLVSPEGVVFENTIWQLTACNTEGWFSIRAHHADFFTSLKSCTVELASTPEKRQRYEITGGFLEFQHNGGCTLLCEDNVKKFN